jgi:hypothetical protein
VCVCVCVILYVALIITNLTVIGTCLHAVQTMDKIGSAITQLTALINDKAPVLHPPVFPQYLPVRNVLDLACSEAQLSAIKKWLGDKNMEASNLGLNTLIDYPGRKIIIDHIEVSHYINFVYI